MTWWGDQSRWVRYQAPNHGANWGLLVLQIPCWWDLEKRGSLVEEESEETIGRKEPSSREHKLKGKEKGRCPFARKAKRKGGAHCQGRCPLAREAAPTTSPAHRWIDQSAPDINHPTAATGETRRRCPFPLFWTSFAAESRHLPYVRPDNPSCLRLRLKLQ